MTLIDVSRGRMEHDKVVEASISNLEWSSKSLAELLLHPRYYATDPGKESAPYFAGSVQVGANIPESKALSERLFDALSAFKIKTASVAMHLDDDWRRRFFSQLDSLLEKASWELDDRPPSVESFTTLLRMLLLFYPMRRPGLGATSDGFLIAAWTAGKDRLTIECREKDRVKWVLSCSVDGEREAAAGDSTLPNLKRILAPYSPQRWFRADNVPQS